jgi:DNA-binding response OmpR family regulator
MIDARLVWALIVQPAPSISRSPGIRILLAEDNPQDVFLLKEAFEAEELDIKLDCVSDGDQLLTRLLALGGQDPNSYHLVLLDSHLPRRTAEDVLTIVNARQQRFDTPIIVLTNLISEQEKGRLVCLGVKEVFAKPLDLNEYASLVRQLNSILDGAQ